MSVTDVLSIQLYTLRSLDDLDRILDVVANAGYRWVETVGSHLDNAAEVRAKLDARGLKASSSHVGLAALRERPDAVARRAGRSASPTSSCPPCRRSSATWERRGGARSARNSAAWRSASGARASGSATTTTIGS